MTVTEDLLQKLPAAEAFTLSESSTKRSKCFERDSGHVF